MRFLLFIGYLGRFSFYDLDNPYQKIFVQKYVIPYSKHIKLGSLVICWSKKRK